MPISFGDDVPSTERSLERIATSLERIAECLENKNQ